MWVSSFLVAYLAYVIGVRLFKEGEADIGLRFMCRYVFAILLAFIFQIVLVTKVRAWELLAFVFVVFAFVVVVAVAAAGRRHTPRSTLLNHPPAIFLGTDIGRREQRRLVGGGDDPSLSTNCLCVLWRLHGGQLGRRLVTNSLRPTGKRPFEAICKP